MKTLPDYLFANLRIGISVAMVGGGLFGLLVGLGLVWSENSSLLLDGVVRIVAAPVLLMSLGALLCSLLFLPLVFSLSGMQRLWPAGIRLNLGRFYTSILIVGVASAHSLFWLGFSVVRDIQSGRAIAYIALLGLVAVGLLIILLKLRPQRRGGEPRGFSPRLLSALAVLFVALAALSYQQFNPATQVEGSMNPPPELIAPSTARPTQNVLLISIDTLRADHLGSYGYERNTSPNIDQVADEGLLFRNARSHSPWTLPSHATMFTSLYPSSNGVEFADSSRFFSSQTADRLSERHVTLAETLQAAGLRTAAIVSSSWVAQEFGLTQGFQSVEYDLKKHTAPTLVDNAITWLADDQGQSSFLFLHFFDVHEYKSPPPFSEQFLPRTGAGRQGSMTLNELQKRAMANLFDELGETDLNYLVGKYDGALRYVDEELGRLFDWLRQQGRYDDTLIIITSDHGEEFWDHGGTGHGFTLYEEQLRVPLIMKPAHTTAHNMPLIREANVGVIDIVPTVLDLMDLPLLPLYQGESLVPLMETDKELPRPMLAEATYFRNRTALITNHTKYIGNRFLPADFFEKRLWFASLRTVYTFREDELFRLDSDPRESINLISEETATASVMRNEVLVHLRNRESLRLHEMDEETLKQLRSMGYIQ